MLWKFRTFSEHLPEHQDCFFSGIPDTPRKCITFGIIISVICLTRAVFFFRYSGHSQDMYYIWHIYFGYFGHSAVHLFVHMLQKFHIFSGHLPEHQGSFFSDIPDTPRTCITVGIFILDILDIQQLIYLCTFS